MDFDRYLRCVELPADDDEEDTSLIHYSSCPAFSTEVYVSTDQHEERCRRNSSDSSASCLHCRRKKISSAPRHVTVYELRQRLDDCHQQRSCLRSRPSSRGASPIRQSVQNHWAWSHGHVGSNLAVYLGKALTLHTSPGVKRRRRKKQVKFADQYGETLATFSLFPPKQDDDEETEPAADTGYWSFIQQTLYEQECEDEEPITGWPSYFMREDDDTTSSSSSTPTEESRDNIDEADNVPQGPTCSICFEQPAANLSTFHAYVEKHCVGLENVKVDTRLNVVKCSIKVKNLHPVKRVFARCTSNGWRTFADLSAEYVDPGYEGSAYDSFCFAITRPLIEDDVVRVEFAICYEVNGQTFWDNHGGQNYAIEWTQDRSQSG